MDQEKHSGVGRKHRRLLVRLWKESGQVVSLKEWAKNAPVGDVAQVWLASKKEPKS